MKETAYEVIRIEQPPQFHPIDWSIPNDHLKEPPDWVWVEVLVLMSDFRPNIGATTHHWLCVGPVIIDCSSYVWYQDSGLGLEVPVVKPVGLVKSLITQDVLLRLENTKSSAFILRSCKGRSIDIVIIRPTRRHLTFPNPKFHLDIKTVPESTTHRRTLKGQACLVTIIISYMCQRPVDSDRARDQEATLGLVRD